ncbi:DUF2812 domain-containing protein [Nocardiopsis algeriensis]|uniref:DUF2812 domain-containing protein n=1 Tax=Nocardiopsis algeriensis TaxID=1478215 RepID=A0A841IR83_9ACTN|nr:DUF2812 domain-containing protein [Nocardiopsis algeriensis]MBB6118728.1 hypothetical protein [Nocardiopsis algeriensis]
MSGYFTALAGRLAELGVDGERSRRLLDELLSYTAESGTDPEEEFGPVDRFAAELTRPAGEEEGDDPETLVWTADAFEGPARLDEMGRQGWEVERVDRLGRFVSRRDPERPQVWAYRQEMCAGRADRERLARRLAPEGWEPCGHWSVLAYFKRPGSATAGPEAEIEAPPAPRRRYFFGARGLVAVVLCLAVALVGVGSSIHRMATGGGGADEWAGFAVGAVVGAVVALGVLWLGVRLGTARRNRNKSDIS